MAFQQYDFFCYRTSTEKNEHCDTLNPLGYVATATQIMYPVPVGINILFPGQSRVQHYINYTALNCITLPACIPPSGVVANI